MHNTSSAPVARRTLLPSMVVIQYMMIISEGARTSFGGDTIRTQVLNGGRVDFSCRKPTDDIPFLVVWYKGDEPIYRLFCRVFPSSLADVSDPVAGYIRYISPEDGPCNGIRNVGQRGRKHTADYDGRDLGKMATSWSHKELFGHRADVGPFATELSIDPVTPEDAGEYRCRVDFRNAPTRNSKFHLTVVVAPGKPNVYDDQGKEIKVHTAGPFLEGSDVRLTCMVEGGNPTPIIQWWHDDEQIESADVSAIFPKTKSNQIVLRDIQRKDLGTIYVCKVFTSKLLPTLITTVTLDMYLRPTALNIIRDPMPFSNGRRHEINCMAEGSVPPPSIGWWLGDVHLTDFIQKDSEDGNSSTSTLYYTPTISDNGKVLTCRANNIYIEDEHMETAIQLDVYYAPIIHLELGMNMNPDDIEEGDDVYFECKIDSNPTTYKIIWKHNNQLLQHSVRYGIIISNSHLALQNVAKSQAGNYTCIASNVEGDGLSNAVDLKVMYKPICKDDQKKLYGLAKGEKASISCSVDSVPAPSNFRWAFNNTAETRDLIEPLFEEQDGQFTSILSYTPSSEIDYGTILCWATNIPGRQREPCVYHIIPGGKPDPPINCTLLNQTTESLDVECLGGFDGGQEQKFVMEVYDQTAARLQANVSSSTPRFVVSGLQSGIDLYLEIYAANRRGRSERANLEGFTLKSPDFHTRLTKKSFDSKLIVGILIGVFFTTAILAAVVVVAIKANRKGQEAEEVFSTPPPPLKEKGSVPLTSSETESIFGDKNPDVIRFNKGTFHREPGFPESDYQADSVAVVNEAEEWRLPPPLAVSGVASHRPITPHVCAFNNQGLPCGDLRIKHPQYDYLMETQDGKVMSAPMFGHMDYAGCLDSAVSIRPIREVVTVRTPLMFNQQQESCV